MVSDAYDFTDELHNLITKEGKLIAVSKELNQIEDNAERVKFVERLLLERNLIPTREDGMRKKKCNKLSKEYRDEGNKHYSNHRFFDALECYNKSLCFAEENSENVGLAYANRSAVYCEMKLYSRALNNIERALNNNYPKKGIDKLVKREELCKRALEEEGREGEPSNVPVETAHFKLAHESNPKLPFIADCLKLKCDDTFGRYIVTDKDLKSGEVVAIEEPFSKCLLPANKYIYCSNCLDNSFFDLLPCAECTCVMFCSDSCRSIGLGKFHQYECPIIDSLNEICTKIMRIASQTFFEALSLYDGNIDQLMAADSEKSHDVNLYDFDMSDSGESERDKKIKTWWAIDSLITNESNREPGDFFQRCGIVAILTHLFLNFTKLGDLLSNESAKDFYLRFITKQTQIAALNYHGIFDGVFKSKAVAYSTQYGSGSYPFCSLINHSCAPNVVRVSHDCKNYVMVNRPIRAGEQLFDNYGYHHCLEDYAGRQKALAAQYMFKCSCEACHGNYPLFQDLQPATANVEEIYRYEDIDKLQMLDLETAKKKFGEYCTIIDNLDKHYPCIEVSALQECILQCLFIFKMTPYKLRLMN